MILIFNGRSCLPCTALPYSRTAAYPQFNTPPIHEIGRGPRRGTPFYVRTISSVWGHFGCFTRSAFRRTPSLNKQHFLVTGSSVVVLSVVSRSSLGKIRQGTREGKETPILIKSTFWRLGVLWSFLGSSLVFYTEHIYKEQGKGILIIVLFCAANLLLFLDMKLTIASNKKRNKK